MTSPRMKNILRLVADCAVKLMDVDRFYVTLYDDVRSRLDFPLVMSNGEVLETGRGPWSPRPYKGSVALPDYVIEYRTPLLVEKDLEEWIAANNIDYPLGEPPLSWLGSPMIVGEKVIGAIIVENTNREGAYGKDGLRLLSTMAHQTAIAIENARLYERLDRKIANLRAVNEVGQRLTSGIGLSEEQILELIYEQATPLMDTRNMYIALYEPDPSQPDEYNKENPKQSVIHGTVRFGLALDDGRRVDVGHEEGWGPRPADEKPGLTEYVIRTRQAHRPVDVEKAYKTYATEHIGKIPRSWMGVPMMVEDKVLGVVVLRNDEYENVYGEDDLEVLQAIAGQAAVAIQNARLLSELDQRLQRLETVHQVGRHVTRILTLKPLVQEAVELIHERFGYFYVAIMLVDPLLPSELVYFAGAGGFAGRTPEGYRQKIGEGMIGWVAQTGQSLLANDVSKEPRYIAPYLPETRSELDIPLKIGSRVIGVLDLQSGNTNAFQKRDIPVLEILADQLAIAVENARLYDEIDNELKLRIAELETLNRELEEARKQAVRATLSAMAGGYVHRLNGALGFIPASIDDVIGKVSTDEQDVLQDIRGGVVEALAYTKRMTDLFTGQELPRESVDVNLMLKTVVHKLRIPSKIRLIWELASDLPEIMADRMFLTEVFNNIIVNALEAMESKPQGELRIGSRLADIEEVEILISDTGCGILEKNLSRIFEPEFTTKPGRHGIGLWFCDTVVKVHGGRINVDSSPELGTTFTVVLPVGGK